MTLRQSQYRCRVGKHHLNSHSNESIFSTISPNITHAFWFLLTQAMLKCKEQHHQHWPGSKLMLSELWYTRRQLIYDQPCALTHYNSNHYPCLVCLNLKALGKHTDLFSMYINQSLHIITFTYSESLQSHRIDQEMGVPVT